MRSETIAKTQVGCVQIELIIIALVNTAHDYRVSVDDPDTGFFRQWHCGANRSLAFDCYGLAVSFVRKVKCGGRQS